MDERILVEVYVPAAEQYWDIYVPLHVNNKALQDNIMDGIETLSQGMFVASSSSFLYVVRLDTVLPQKGYVWESGIQNGDCLVLL